MNERIRELAEQADVFEYKTYYDPTFSKSVINDDKVKKFAELIIQECMHMCEVAQWGCITHGWDKQAQGCQSVQEYIAEHFGIEE
jgi:hypothetical protein